MGSDAIESEMIWMHRYAAGIDRIVDSVIVNGPLNG